MAAVATEDNPHSLADVGRRAEIPWHMTRGLYDEQTAVAEEVHCLFEGTKGRPRPFKLFPSFCCLLWVKETAIPL